MLRCQHKQNAPGSLKLVSVCFQSTSGFNQTTAFSKDKQAKVSACEHGLKFSVYLNDFEGTQMHFEPS